MTALQDANSLLAELDGAEDSGDDAPPSIPGDASRRASLIELGTTPEDDDAFDANTPLPNMSSSFPRVPSFDPQRLRPHPLYDQRDSVGHATRIPSRTHTLPACTLPATRSHALTSLPCAALLLQSAGGELCSPRPVVSAPGRASPATTGTRRRPVLLP